MIHYNFDKFPLSKSIKHNNPIPYICKIPVSIRKHGPYTYVRSKGFTLETLNCRYTYKIKMERFWHGPFSRNY